MKIKILQVDDILLIGLILMIGSLFFMHAEIPLYGRTIFVVGVVIVWLICVWIAYVFIGLFWKKHPSAENAIERNYDERAQVLNAKARTYSGRLLQILLIIFSIFMFTVYNKILISLILLLLCGIYNLSFYIIRHHLEKNI